MKIQVQDKSENGPVIVWGVWGPRTIEMILERLKADIANVNNSLRVINKELEDMQ